MEQGPRPRGLVRIVHDRIDAAQRLLGRAVRGVRDGLRRPGPLPGDVGRRRHRHLDDGVDRLPRRAIQEVRVAVLAERGDAAHRPAVDRALEQDRPVAEIEVPQVVVNRLEVPRELAGLQVQGDDGVGEEVQPGPFGAVEVGRGVRDVEVDHAQLGIDGRLRPDASAPASARAPRILRELPPGVRGPLGNRCKRPLDGPGRGIERDQQAAADEVGAARRRHEDRAVVIQRRRGQAVSERPRVVDAARIPVGVLQRQRVGDHGDRALPAERLRQPARRRVHGVEQRPDRGIDAAPAVRRPPAAGSARIGVPRREQGGQLGLDGPQPAARPGIHGEQPGAVVEVQHAVDDQRRLLTDRVGVDVQRPGRHETVHVGRVDLVERREAGVLEVEVVQRPADVARFLRGGGQRLLRQGINARITIRRKRDARRDGRHS